ncbi:hypothetical protein KW792_02340 [Candidatus Saccharibacteria bacterium]|nr:hypothetical protein [Candidatus Saccharibacteria bacterium]
MLIVGAICALAILTAQTRTAQASSSLSAVAATAAHSCGQVAAPRHRSSATRYLSSTETTTIKTLCSKAWGSFSKARFIRNHRVLTAPRYKHWWNVPDKKWRQTVRKSRAILRKNEAALAKLKRRIDHLQERAIMNFDGYVPPSEARSLGAKMAAQWGWTAQNGQWRCLDLLWGTYESSWNMHADNPHSDAYGIPQALPGSKMGSRWMTSVWTQINWGLDYIAKKFKSPCGALAVRLAQGSY